MSVTAYIIRRGREFPIVDFPYGDIGLGSPGSKPHEFASMEEAESRCRIFTVIGDVELRS